MVEYEADRVTKSSIRARIRGLGYGVAGEETVVTSEFRLCEVDPGGSQADLRERLLSLHGVIEASVDGGRETLTVKHKRELLPRNIVQVIEEAGYTALLELERPVKGTWNLFWQRNRRIIVTAASGLWVAIGAGLWVVGAPPLWSTLAYALAMVVGGYPIARSGIFSLVRLRTPDINVLMMVAVIGAAAIGEWVEGATVVFLFSLGNTLESYTMDRARGAIRALMNLSPPYAKVKRNGVVTAMPVAEVEVEDVVAVRPGERIPRDGRVVAGSSTVDQSPITGESVPVAKTVGDEVFAGTINQRGYLEVSVTKPYEENALSRIIHLVEEAQSRKAPSQRFVDRFARYYTPGVIGLAILMGMVPPFLLGQPFDVWFYRALVLLVISCPCALVISTPVSIVSAIGSAARAGVLIKGGVHLEEAGSIRVVAFDKTGTLTRGDIRVVDVLPLNGHRREEVMPLAAAVESHSEHPLAAAVMQEARHEGVRWTEITDFEAIPGLGARASVNGSTYYVGSLGLFRRLSVPLGDAEIRVRGLEEEGKTPLLVGTPQEVVGIVAVADQPRVTAQTAVQELHQSGIETVVMLTGDNEGTARSVAKQVGVDDYRAELLPQDKVDTVKGLLGRYGKVAMVGDGVNDAPALAASTVGIAMGGAGSDVALETADIVLMGDNPAKVPYVMHLSRRTLSIIRQNIAFAIMVKAVFVALAFPGWTTLWMAVAADVGTSLVVILNGMRLLRHHD
ncbi:MAG: cadmium-translocating P-type ATPase [Chloroflexi bacterium]|nr:cadmium-translocating P-type ATPase [Chloroflexota bacterium]